MPLKTEWQSQSEPGTEPTWGAVPVCGTAGHVLYMVHQEFPQSPDCQLTEESTDQRVIQLPVKVVPGHQVAVGMRLWVSRPST